MSLKGRNTDYWGTLNPAKRMKEQIKNIEKDTNNGDTKDAVSMLKDILEINSVSKSSEDLLKKNKNLSINDN